VISRRVIVNRGAIASAILRKNREQLLKELLRGLWKSAHAHMANDPSSATRPTMTLDCNRSVMAGFAAAHG